MTILDFGGGGRTIPPLTYRLWARGDGMASRPRSGLVPGAAVLACLVWVFAGGFAARAQEPPKTNPLAGDPAAIKLGQNIFRGRCAVCHGIDAKGYRGSDLTSGDWVHGGADAQIFKTITHRRARHRDARQSSTCPKTKSGCSSPTCGRSAPPAGRWPSAATRPAASSSSGPPAAPTAAAATWWAAAAGVSDPILSRIGASRSATALEREIRRPGEVIPDRLRDHHRDDRATAGRSAACGRTKTRSRCR